MMRKMNTFTDFIDCGNYLVNTGKVEAHRLFAQGGSAGGMLMDTNRATRDIAGGLADIPGPHKGEIREALRQRLVDTAPRMAASLDKNTVPHVNIRQLEKTIDTMQDAASKPLYDAFVKDMIQTAYDEVPRVPLFQPTMDVAMQKDVMGYQYWFHLQPDRKSVV